MHEICTCLGFKSTLEDNLKVSRMLSQFGEVLLKNRFLNQVKSKEDSLVVRCIFGLRPIVILNILNKFYNYVKLTIMLCLLSAGTVSKICN